MALDDAALQAFQRDGYLLRRGLFHPAEIERLRGRARADREIDRHSFAKEDGEGGSVRLALWNQPGDGIYGRFARCRRVVDTMEDLLGDEVYHYHSKMILKDPEVGGAWTWHQDYGYWYQNGLLFPDLASVMVAVDPASRENGCLEVLRASHRCGRIHHETRGEQAGADVARVEQLAAVLDHEFMELEPGDALFFHCNLLHRSGQNRSPNPRWALICCYNTRHNEPTVRHHHPGYTPLRKVEDDEVLGADDRASDVAEELSWLDPERDRTHRWEASD